MPNGGQTYTEGGLPVLFDSAPTVTDPDSANFDTGTLTASIPSNASADDRITIRNQGTSAGEIGVTGSDVTYGGVIIGTWTGGTSGTTPLVVTFNSNATVAAVQALAGNVQFSNVSDTPSEAARLIRMVVTDGDGGTSNAAQNLLNVVAMNDEQVLATNAGTTVSENSTGNVITNAMLLTTDVDNTAGQLTYTISSAVSCGTVRLNGTALSNGSTFTQADINSGLVAYDHDGTENFTDAFSFSVDDGAGSTSTGTFSITITPVNDNDPTITSNGAGATASISIAENTTAVTTVTATDSDLPTQTLTYSLAGSADAGLFTIDSNSGVLSFSSARDFESPSDADGDGVYIVTVEVSDGARTYTQTISVTITDVNEGSVSAVVDSDSAADTVAENSVIGITVGVTAVATDPDGTDVVTYSLTDDAGGRFAINPNTGVMTVAGAIDREAAASYDITIRATSTDTSFTSLNVTISITDVNEFSVSTPVDIDATANSVAENAANGTLVGITASAVDGDATTNSVTYSLDDDAGGRFAIDANSGVVTVANGSLLNFEAATSHDIVIRATSSDLSTATQVMTITLTDVNETQVAVADTAIAVEAGGTANGTAGTDPTDNVLTNDTDVDAGDTKAVSGVVAGYSASASGSVGADVAGIYGTINIADDGTFSYVVDNTNAAVQALRTSSDTLTDVFTYTMIDSGGLTSTTQITITIQCANDEQVFVPGIGQAFAENSVGNVITADSLLTTDIDNTAAELVYTLISIPVNGNLRLNGVALSASDTFTQADVDAGLVTYDHDGTETNSDSFAFSVDDGVGANSSAVVNFAITPVNDNTPIITSDGGAATASISIAENTTAVTTVTATDADLPSQNLTYSVVGGADAASFTIDGVTGVLTFIVAPDFDVPGDFDGDNVYDVIVEASDGTLSSTQTISVTITDISSLFLVTTDSDVDDSGLGAAYNIEQLYAANGGTDGQISLREALIAANNTSGVDTITFNIAGVGVRTISIASQLPEITEAVIIDGQSNPNFAGTPVIQLDGTAAGAVDGLIISGGGSTIRGLIISNFAGTGIALSGLGGNTIESNWIGTDNTGTAGASNSIGILVSSSGNIIGGTTAGSGNVIAFNSGAGIEIASTADTTSILGNAIYSNTGLGIDLGGDGVTLNDANDIDTGANSLTNFPVITVASRSNPSNLHVEGTLNAEASTQYRIEIFANGVGVEHASGYGAAERYLGFVLVTTDVSGNASFSTDLAALVAIGETVTATATDAAGNTSEFGANHVIIGPTPILDLDADDSSGQTGADFIASFVEDGSPVKIADTDAIAWDPDTPNLNRLTVTITNLLDGADEVLSADTSGTPLIANYSNGVLTIGGAANETIYQQVLRTITYSNMSQNADNTTRVLTVTVEDGVFGSNVATSRIQILTSNDAPTIVSNSLTITEGDTVVLTSTDLNSTDFEQTASQLTYTITGISGGRFEYVATPGVAITGFTQADINGGLVQFVHDGNEVAPSYNVTIGDGSLSNGPQTVNVTFTGANDTPVMNPATFSLPENSTLGTSVGFVTSSDTDAGDTANYSIVAGNTNGAFGVNVGMGEIIALNSSALDFETTPTFSLTMRVTDGGGLFHEATVTINLTNINEDAVTAITDMDGTVDSVAENAANGTLVGIVAFAEDYDVPDTVSYSLDDNASGRFAIDSVTGVVTVADGLQLDYEAATSHSITVRATSTDTSFSVRTFVIQLTDVNEGGVSAISDVDGTSNAVAENAANGTAVGYTAFAVDPDGTLNTITYTLDDTAGGRFAIDSVTGVVTVADGTFLDREADASHTILIRATSDDGSFSTLSVDISLIDVNEFAISAAADVDATANVVAELSLQGTLTGITVRATDADATTNAITYLLDDSAGGRFQIDTNTGVVSVGTTPLDYETASSYAISARATSADGSTSTITLTVNLIDVNEFGITAISDSNAAANAVFENAANGTLVGITAQASDDDGTDLITYALTANAGGRFAIDAATGVVTVADGTLLDREVAASYNIIVQASSTDGSTSSQSYTIDLGDVNEFAISSIIDANPVSDAVNENATNGTVVGIAGLATDADATTNTVTYSLDDNAGGRFAIDATTGVITVADGTLLDYETVASHTIVIRATSADSSTTTQSFTIAINDVNEFAITSISDTNAAANTVAENAANGTVVGITAFASDADASTNTVTYSLADDAGGRFAIDAVTGIITVADGTLLNREVAASHSVVVQGVSADGSTSSRTFTIDLLDVNEFNVSPITDMNAALDEVNENAVNGTVVGIVANSFDNDGTTNAITYTLDDNAGGRFAIDSVTGIVTVANGLLLDYETAASHNMTVRATSADTSTTTRTFTISLIDVNDTPPAIVSGQQFSVSELATVGTSVGNAIATDADGIGSLQGWTITGGNVDNIFSIDPTTGRITVTDINGLNFEATSSYALTLTVADGNNTSAPQSISINVVDQNEAPVLNPSVVLSVNENSSNGTLVGTVTGSDVDAGDVLTYWILSSGPVAPFSIDAVTGRIRVLDSSLLNFEAATTVNLTVEIRDAAVLTDTQIVTVQINDVNEAPNDIVLNGTSVQENSAVGTLVGTLSGADPDAGDSLTFSLVNSAGGRFAINTTTGTLRVASASSLNFEVNPSHVITVRATDTAGYFYDESFTVTIVDVNDAPVAVADQYVTMQLTPVLTTSLNSVLSNDYDEDGSLLSVIIVTGPADGTLTMSADGTFQYSPDGVFAGIDTFTYQVTDGQLNSSIVTVTINVQQTISAGPGGGSGNTGATGSGGITGSTTGGTSTGTSTGGSSTGGTTTGGTSVNSGGTTDGAAGGATSNPPIQDTVASAGGSQGFDQEQIIDAVEESLKEIREDQMNADADRVSQMESLVISGLARDYEQSASAERRSGLISVGGVTRNTTSLFGGAVVVVPVDAIVSFRHFVFDTASVVQQEQTNTPESQITTEKIVVGSTAVVSTSISVGYVIWILRGGSLLTAFMSAMPAWQAFDPLPVLQSFEKHNDDEDDTFLSIVTRKAAGVVKKVVK